MTATLLLHVFNNLQISESIKFFHLGAGVALIFGLPLIKRGTGQIGKIAILFVTTSLFSCIVSPYDQSISVWVKLLIILGATIPIIAIPIKKLVTGVNFIIPIALIALVKEYFAGIYYRYQGFYEDPNYMCTTLLVMFFYLQLMWEMNSKKLIRAFMLIEMVVVLFLVTTSISRTGLICFSIMTIGFFWDNFKRNKFITLVGVVAVSLATFWAAPALVERALENYTMRETENRDTLDHAADLRKEISMRGVKFVLSNPIYLIQGMGEGATAHASSIPGFHVRTHHGDHNTLTCCFSEQGIVGLSLMLSLYFCLFKRLWKKKGAQFRKLRLISTISLLVFIIFSMSINQMVYLPYWFMIFTLSNLAQNENSAHCLLR